MPARERNSLSFRTQGVYRRFGINWVDGGELLQSQNFCGDIVDSGDNAPFHVHHRTLDGGVLNKPDLGFFSSSFHNYVVDGHDPDSGHLDIPDDQSSAGWATVGAARTNPSRPSVDVPVNILELGDIARTLRTASTNVLGRVGAANLSYQYGIRPIASDLAKLTQFSDLVDSRVRELSRFVRQQGLRRTVPVFAGSNTESREQWLQTDGVAIRGVWDVTTLMTVKVHARWLPGSGFESMSAPSEMRALARRAVLGLTLDNSTLWEAMPWSWLVDWCTTTGDWFKSQRNIVPATLSDVSVMRHTKTTYSCTPPTSPDWSLTPLKVVREDKSRVTSFVAPVAHFPFLNGNQMGILTSLAVTR